MGLNANPVKMNCRSDAFKATVDTLTVRDMAMSTLGEFFYQVLTKARMPKATAVPPGGINLGTDELLETAIKDITARIMVLITIVFEHV